AIGVVFGARRREPHARELAVFVHERFRIQPVQDFDALVFGVFLFPRAGLHFFGAGTYDHLDGVATEPARAAAAIHRGIATAQDAHALAALLAVAEIDGSQPLDADVDLVGVLLASGNMQIAPA